MEYEPTTTSSNPDRLSLNQSLLYLWFQNLLPALELWEQSREKGNTQRTTRELKSIIKTMIWSVKSSMDIELQKEKKGEKKKFSKARELLTHLDNSDKDEELYEVIDILESFLYAKGVIKWDTKEVVDRKQVWNMNQRFQG
jgi:hypothetical protein